MKKLILMATMLGVSMDSYAQGTVDFRNLVGVAPNYIINAPVYEPEGAPLGNTNFVAQLFYGPTTATEGSLTAVADLPARFRSGAGAGSWNSGLISSSRTLLGIMAGADALVQVRVWDQSVFGPTGYTVAGTTPGAQVGKSTMFSMSTGGGGSGAPTLPTFMTGLTSFNTIIVVPEPSTIALGVLGAVFFLMRKRM